MDVPVRVDLGSSIAPHEQVRLQLLALVALRRLHPGDAVPEVRELDETALPESVVAHAVAALERSGVLVTGPDRLVTVGHAPTSVPAGELRAAAVALAERARAAGMDEHQVLDLVHDALLGPTGRRRRVPSQRRRPALELLPHTEPGDRDA